ncbi:MAG: VOC family protein [Candidatus Methylacidiphilales bacterium]
MTDTPCITGFHHVAIRVRDFDRSLAFYTEILGLSPRVAWGEAPTRAVMLGAEDRVYLEIFERPAQAAASGEEGTLLHFALRTPDASAMLERARTAGCEVTMEPKEVNIGNTHPSLPSSVPVKIAFVKGPDGEVIEFFENQLT